MNRLGKVYACMIQGMTLFDQFTQASAPWPPKGYGSRVNESDRYNALFEGNHSSLRFWVREVREKTYPISEFVPYPVAEIAVRTLSSFLFGEDAAYTSEEDQEALDQLIRSNHLHALNQEAAVTCPVEGEVYYRVDWDETVSDRGIVSVIPGGSTFPVFRHNRLTEVAFVQTWSSGSDDLVRWRHIEVRTEGLIQHLLFRGTPDALGDRMELDEHERTEGMEEEVVTGIPDLLVRQVPFWRTAASPHGISIFRGKEGLIAGLHALYSQDQHDAEMAMRRVFMTEEYLKKDEKGRPVFNRDIDLFVLDTAAAPALGESGQPVTAVEFHDSTIMGERIEQRIDEFLLACGIAPQSAGRNVAGTAESGTARKLAQALTLQTVASVGRYFSAALEDTLRLASVVTNVHLDGSFPLLTDVSVEMSDGLVDDETEIATNLQSKRTAGVISIHQAVSELHPAWAEDEVETEVERIEAEAGLDIPDVFREGNTEIPEGAGE